MSNQYLTLRVRNRLLLIHVYVIAVSESNPIFAGLSWELLYFHPDGSSGLHYEAILLSPKVSPFGASPPLAVVPHGGPNDIYSTQFSVWPTCLAALGFAVLQGT